MEIMKSFKIQSLHQVSVKNYEKGIVADHKHISKTATIQAVDKEVAIEKYFTEFLKFEYDHGAVGEIEGETVRFYDGILTDIDDNEVNPPKGRAIFDRYMNGEIDLYQHDVSVDVIDVQPFGMKSHLPKSIESVDDAKKFLLELISNNEIFHPEDDANDVIWSSVEPMDEEKEQLNKLMSDIYGLPECQMKDDNTMDFDPCGFILDQTRVNYSATLTKDGKTYEIDETFDKGDEPMFGNWVLKTVDEFTKRANGINGNRIDWFINGKAKI